MAKQKKDKRTIYLTCKLNSLIKRKAKRARMSVSDYVEGILSNALRSN